MGPLGPDFKGEFEKDLAALLNRHGVDNALGVPDYILAEYLRGAMFLAAHLHGRTETWKKIK